jgi:hypothetical protein
MSRQTTELLLAELLHRGVVPVIVAGRLRLDAPPGALDASIRGRLTEELPELRRLVASLWRPREHCWSTPPCKLMTCCQRAQLDPESLREAGMIACGILAVCALCRTPLPEGRRYLCVSCSEHSEVNTTVARGAA